MNRSARKNIYRGIGLAVLAAFIWSGNFIVAKAVNQEIPPISLNFYRWFLASLLIFPFAYNHFKKEWPVVKQSWHYLFWISLCGISLFNSFVYIGAHHTTAINLALIGTTTSPILSVLFARIFLNERIGLLKGLGMILCIAGVVYLLAKGDLENLRHFRFSTGDLWMLLAAFFFAVYNVMAKKKPAALSPVNFLFVIFTFGTVLTLPFFLWEMNQHAAVPWDGRLLGSVFYLGLGASVICFYIWNIAIRYLGAGRAALFGNLIPVFSSIEAALFLQEDFTAVHVISMLIVFAGILLANMRATGR